MPLTVLQKEVLAVLAPNRGEESHFAGGVVLHAADASSRYSYDFDIFHDLEEEVTRASNHDVETLRAAGFEVQTLSSQGTWDKPSTFRKARVLRAGASVEVDWAADSAFRFFPVERDLLFGWRLHHFDVATNKALTLGARTETRDYVDIIELHRRFSLAAICWAACGKDPGFTPLSLLKMMRRFARVNPQELDKITAQRLDPVALKQTWIEISDTARVQIEQLADERPEVPIGVAFVNAQGNPGWLGDDPTLRVHAPSLRGCWPKVRGAEGSS